MRFFPSGDWAKFARWVALALAVYTLLPYLWALFVADGRLYLGYQTNLDDHMVYAAWMRQAQDFQFLFDNRFTTDPQPGLTIHLFFFALGVVSKFLGIGLTTTVAKVGLSFVFVMLLARLLETTGLTSGAKKVSLVLATFGSGFGVAAWQAFGVAYDPSDHPLAALTSKLLPIDVWQPEAFVFSSSLTNALFMFALCVMIVVFLSVLAARESWKPVVPGALAMLVMMNTHSYDVLIVSTVFVALLASSWGAKRLTPAWAARASVIGLGAVPSAMWFLYVLNHDAVFQARAVTRTFSPSFQQVLFGLLPMVVAGLGFVASSHWKTAQSKWMGIGAVAGVSAVLYGMAQSRDTNQFFLTMPAFLVVLGVMVAAAYLTATEDDTLNLLSGWAFAGLVLPYAPFLFQRKLEMGLVVPWAVLAGAGLVVLGSRVSAGLRRPVALGGGAVLCVTALMWFFRDLQFIQNDVSSTTVHAVFYGKDVSAILDALNKVPGRKVVAAPPGIPYRIPGKTLAFGQPIMPDLNPVVSGMTGAHTVAGHWSETPRYSERRDLLQKLFFRTKAPVDKRALVDQLGIDYLVAPTPTAFPEGLCEDLSGLGTTVYQGERFSLVKVR